MELKHCRELLKEAVKDKTKQTMQLQTNTAPDNTEKEEAMVVEGEVPCTFCSIVANSMTELKDHFKKHHKFDCTKCDMKFLHKHALNVHMEKHIQKIKVVSTHVCKVCQAIHRNKNDLKSMLELVQ